MGHEKSNSVSSSALTGVILLVAQQFGSRFLTFTANQILLRYISPDLLGISAQLELFSITVLFFSRESLRLTLHREQVGSSPVHHPCLNEEKNNEEKKNPKEPADIRTEAGRIQALVNLAYVSLSLGIVVAFVLAWLYLRNLNTRDSSIAETPYFKFSLLLVGCASILELLAEPSYIIVQQKSRHFIRVGTESTATILRCLISCISAICARQVGTEIGVLSFALGHIAYSITLLTIYLWNVIEISSVNAFSLLPRSIYSPNPGEVILSYISRPHLILSQSFFIQSVFKYILTQGDTFVISLLASSRTQGVYSLANSYGGLLARIVLQPIEESSRNYFGRLLSTTGKNSHTVISKVHKSLFKIFYTYLTLSIIIVSIGPSAAPLLLKMVAGSKWSESGAGKVLGWYCYYIPLLAINGLTEAFVSSVSTKSEVHRQTAWMLVFSIAFAGAAFFFLQFWEYGAKGLVLANSINMIFRIAWSIKFIKSYLGRWRERIEFGTLMPRPTTIAAGAVASAALAKTENNFDGNILNLCRIGAIAGGLLIAISISERKHFLALFHDFNDR
ncbi:Oligosaccharide translocation protein RFT1 [Golovinomyces cichoracearum]|uniref:Man(5)GlcNAc(2)-PP-dolichol translocation protein RFT1 n=1 Tax=Golovinomyces cichoracearum TaxID=62708 RepID=A0A420ICR7_9PEZI|nr:Oligosaccharide translocation protein RFT1 [Golovinomyces cichoracearum]